MGLSSLFLTSCLLAVSVALITPSKGNDRIVGGKAVNITDYPYQVALFWNGCFDCGGSIIGENLVVTAAHCIKEKGDYAIRVGSSSYEHGGELYYIDRDNITVHEDYGRPPHNNDIALIRTSQPLISINSDARIIQLPITGQKINAGVIAKASGWGTRQQRRLNSDSDDDILHAVEVPIVEHAKCKQYYYPSIITDKMICAGYPNIGGKDSCNGDSGGPLVVDGVLIGIVSWGYGCASPLFPGVYADVVNLRDWIKYHGGV